ncbi:MAG TPA: S9 family peptidase [Gammaproteobacteria bacterium]|nr:S9 family peptidase [Gammaproteobacteria bacterium]
MKGTLHLVALALLALVMLPPPAAARTLSVQDWIRRPEYTQAVISPDGKYLAVVMTQKEGSGDYELVVMNTAALLAGKVQVSARIGLGGQELFGDVFWASDNRVVMSTERYVGGFDRPYPDGRLMSISPHGGRGVTLMGRYAGLLWLPNKNTKEIVVSGYPDGNKLSAYRLDVVTGAIRRIGTAPFAGGMLTDHTGKVRLEWGFNELTGWPKLLYRPADSLNWKDVSSLVNTNKDAAAALMTGGPVMFGPDNKTVYVKSWADNPAETLGLYSFDFDTGAEKLLYANPAVDVDRTLSSFERDSLVGLQIEPGRPETLALNAQAPRMQLLAALQQALPGVQTNTVSWTRDGSEAVVETWSDTEAPAFYLYAGKPKPALQLLFRSTPWINPDDLSPMQPVSYPSRDGLTIHGYLATPRGAAPKDLPLVVYVHGGPYGLRNSWGFDPSDFDSVAIQILANHGYAVLAPNYRGSGGYGFKFLQAGFRHWGDTMQDDLADGVAWAVKQGYADPKRVCILGASYGGYAALMSAERFPDLYRCAIGYSGVYDLAMMESRKTDFSRYAFGNLYTSIVLGKDAAQLRAFSPADNAGSLKASVLLLHGGRDERAPVAGYDEMVAAIKAHGTPLETLFYHNEGHGFYQPEHRTKAWDDILDFLGRSIGPAGLTSASTGSGTH